MQYDTFGVAQNGRPPYTSCMGRAAFAAYLRTLRKRRWNRIEDFEPLLPEDVSGLSGKNYGRFERGEAVPKADALVVLLRLLDGDGTEALALLSDESATAEEGAYRAAQRLEARSRVEAPDRTDPTLAALQQVLAEFEAIENDPISVIDQFRRFLRFRRWEQNQHDKP